MKLTRAVVYGESVSAYAELCASARELAGEVIAVVVGDAAAAATVAELGVEVRLVPFDGSGLLDDYWPVVSDVVAGLGCRGRAGAGVEARACAGGSARGQAGRRGGQ